MRDTIDESRPVSCAMMRSTGPPGANWMMAKLISMMPKSVGMISNRRLRREAAMSLDSVLFQLRSFIGVVPPRVDDALVELRLHLRTVELIPEGDVVLCLVPLRHPVVSGAQHAIEGPRRRDQLRP